jgi:hypothetical protein
MSLVRSTLCGLLAGAAGTLSMDLVLFMRYKRGGGESNFTDWEFASGLSSWDDASAPAKVGKLLYETFTNSELPAARAALTTNLMHWAYGSQWGAVLGVAVGSGSYLRMTQAPLLGAMVWLASYVSLPIAGFYKPIWAYDLKTLWHDLSAHLAYGAGAALTFRLACRF